MPNSLQSMVVCSTIVLTRTYILIEFYVGFHELWEWWVLRFMASWRVKRGNFVSQVRQFPEWCYEDLIIIRHIFTLNELLDGEKQLLMWKSQSLAHVIKAKLRLR
jgi:hypothetical protein